jgi:hypothetical protein
MSGEGAGRTVTLLKLLRLTFPFPKSAAAQGSFDDIACVLHHAGSYVKDVASGAPMLFTKLENVIYLLLFARAWVRISTCPSHEMCQAPKYCCIPARQPWNE